MRDRFFSSGSGSVLNGSSFVLGPWTALTRVSIVRPLLLGFLSFCLTIGLHSPLSQPANAFVAAMHRSPAEQTMAPNWTLDRIAQSNAEQARAVLRDRGAKDSDLKTYVAKMSREQIVPTRANTMAWGTVGAALSGNRLIVRGNFRELSSPLRNYTTDPVSPPNPNITSAFHIHRGMPTENGPFQYALQVMTDETGLAGSAMGEYTLTSEQLDALSKGMLYVDLHTTKNRAGELRAVLMPL